MDEKETREIAEKAAVQSDHHHHVLKATLLVIICLIVLGGLVGIAKLAIFGRNLHGVTFERNVAVEDSDFGGRMMRGGGMMSGRADYHNHRGGIIGTLTKIDGDSLTVHKASTDKDYIVIVSDSTSIRKDGDIASKSDLATGQALTVSGSTNSSGQIEATHIVIN